MLIDCISDLHGHYPQLEGGDLLIVAGDLTAKDTPAEYSEFGEWLVLQKYRSKIYIAGNHDNHLQNTDKLYTQIFGAEYLCDSGTEFEGLKVWGSPYTLRFPGENPKCLAFTCGDEEELAEHWKCIPEDTDILVTHSPPWGVLDRTIHGESVGSLSLQKEISTFKPRLNLMVFGHLHDSYGYLNDMKCFFINASHVNERYEPVNKPIRIEL